MTKTPLRGALLLTGALLAIHCASNGTSSSGGSAGAVAGSPGQNTAGSPVAGAGAPNSAAGASVNAGASPGGTASGGDAAAGALSTGGTAEAGSAPGGASTQAGGSSGAANSKAGAGNPQAGAAGSTPVDPSKKITVWLAGDSTMQPCGSPCPCGWVSQFQAQFGSNVTVVNSGAGGRSIQTWLYDPNVTTMMSGGECVVNPKTYSDRWQAMLDPTKGMKPGDYLFIEFGINDGDATCNRHVGKALFQSFLTTMAQAAKERGAQPIFLTSTSAIICTGATVQPNRGFGPETKAAAMANGVPLIDLTQLSAALFTSLGLCPNDASYTSTSSAVGKFFCDDHTHFEAAGAAQIAAVVSKALRDQSLGLAAYLK